MSKTGSRRREPIDGDLATIPSPSRTIEAHDLRAGRADVARAGGVAVSATVPGLRARVDAVFAV